jgi:hypothetical protein
VSLSFCTPYARFNCIYGIGASESVVAPSFSSDYQNFRTSPSCEPRQLKQRIMTDVQAEAGPSTLPDGGPTATSGATATKAIPVRLTSRTDKHAIPESKFMIPSDWRRFQLSELINKVLGNEQAVPFDFVVGEELLRSSLGQFTQAKGLTEVCCCYLKHSIRLRADCWLPLTRKAYSKSNMSNLYCHRNIFRPSSMKIGYLTSTWACKGASVLYLAAA